jgi:predicted membrane protein
MTYFSTLPAEVLDAIGVAGFGLYVLNYGLLTVQRVQSHQARYFALNGIAATMVLIGLMSAFNLASALIQIFWIVISIVAIIIRLRKRPNPIFSHQTQV